MARLQGAGLTVRGLADPGAVTLLVTLIGLAFGAWILLRTAVATAARRSPPV